MESLQALKSRSKAVTNIGKITKAMEVVATTKMRRSQEVALGTRPYAFKAMELLEKLSGGIVLNSPLAVSREASKTLVVLVASDRGLAGSFNAQVLRAADAFFATDDYIGKVGHKYVLAAVGKYAEIYGTKKKIEIIGKFHGFGDYVNPSDVEPLAKFIIDGFLGGNYDRVAVISTHFRTALKQDVVSRQILPLDLKKIKGTIDELIPERGRYADERKKTETNLSLKKKEIDYIFEPSINEVIGELLPHLLKMQVYHLILEANASEHSARRVAMKSASDNAGDLARKITLEYNKARQAAITNELVEITATQNALN